MKRNLFIITAFSCFLVCAVNGNAQVVIEPSQIDYGTVPVFSAGQPVADRTINVTNHGERLNIDDWNNLPHFSLLHPLIAAIRISIRMIDDSSGTYYESYGEFPYLISQLTDSGLVELPEDLTSQWQISLIGADPVTLITATSTANSPLGEGVTVIYDTQMNRFSYYDLPSLILEPGGNELTVSFLPDSSGDYLQELILGNDTCALRGTGRIARLIGVRQQVINFGGVYENSITELTFNINNPSPCFAQYDFNFTTDDSQDVRFTIYNPRKIGELVPVLRGLDDAVRAFRENRGEEPNSVEQLVGLGYIEIPESIQRQFSLSLIGLPTTIIESVTTAENPWGAGHVTLLMDSSSQLTGFGTGHVILATEHNAQMVLALCPRQVGAVESKLTINATSLMAHDAIELSIHAEALGVEGGHVAITPSALRLSSTFPSPFNSSLSISYSSPTNAPLLISLVDLSGRTLQQNWVPGTSSGKGFATINATSLPSGNYFVILGDHSTNAVLPVRCLK